jgi:cytochrome c oxidase subunit II
MPMSVQEKPSKISVRRATFGVLGIAAVVALCCAPRTHAVTSVPVITIHAVRYEFSPTEITLKKGQTVQLVLIADDVAHGLAVDDLNLHVDMPKHQTQTVFFTPGAVGDFEGGCSRYCGTGHEDMILTVHVKP